VAAIERLKPHASKRREIADAGKPGLYLIIQPKSGAKSWAVRYRHNGKPRKLTLDGFPSLDLARKLAQDALNAVAAGKDPAAEKREKRNAPSNLVEDVFAEFMAKHTKKRNGKPIRNTTRHETARLLGLRLEDGEWLPRDPKSGVLARWAGRDVTGITKRDVLDLLDDRIKKGAPVGANRTLAALKTALAWCVKRDILLASPCDHVDDPSAETPSERTLSDDELGVIWRAAEGQGYPYGDMIRLLTLTGQRRDEVREAVWGELDLERRLWKLPGRRTKNGREHHVPLSGAAMTILERLPRIKSKAGWLFTIGGEVAVSNLARRKGRLDDAVLRELHTTNPEASGIKPWRLHDLRHTLKTWMQQARIAKDVRNAVQNHYDGDMDQLYGHYSFDSEKRETLEAWARHIETIVSAEAANEIAFREATR